mmetsp:Transcript_2591/g.7486  ORF Transcript_2591/g.7486 Transcript_2591/m.7486 type:complete len:362 (+) Transcript_2591:446-1531(+)
MFADARPQTTWSCTSRVLRRGKSGRRRCLSPRSPRKSRRAKSSAAWWSNTMAVGAVGSTRCFLTRTSSGFATSRPSGSSWTTIAGRSGDFERLTSCSPASGPRRSKRNDRWSSPQTRCNECWRRRHGMLKCGRRRMSQYRSSTRGRSVPAARFSSGQDTRQQCFGLLRWCARAWARSRTPPQLKAWPNRGSKMRARAWSGPVDTAWTTPFAGPPPTVSPTAIARMLPTPPRLVPVGVARCPASTWAMVGCRSGACSFLHTARASAFLCRSRTSSTRRARAARTRPCMRPLMSTRLPAAALAPGSQRPRIVKTMRGAIGATALGATEVPQAPASRSQASPEAPPRRRRAATKNHSWEDKRVR